MLQVLVQETRKLIQLVSFVHSLTFCVLGQQPVYYVILSLPFHQ